MTARAGRVALVTGASRGIGAAVARALAADGAAVVLVARDADRLAGVRQEIVRSGGEALVVSADVASVDDTDQMVTRAVAEFGRLDVAVNAAAGHGRRPTRLADVPVEEFDEVIAVTLRGTFLSMRAEIPAILGSGAGGAIVNVTSTAAARSVAGLPGYVASKRALVGLTESAALDYAESGLRINAVAPGPIRTEQLERAGNAAIDRVTASVPVRRLGEVEEVAEAVRWLCSDAASFITGSTVVIDGGLLAGMPTFSAVPAGGRRPL